jgi:hypothetical protein
MVVDPGPVAKKNSCAFPAAAHGDASMPNLQPFSPATLLPCNLAVLIQCIWIPGEDATLLHGNPEFNWFRSALGFLLSGNG